MSDSVDYTEVPYLQEILNFLPINPDDEEDVINEIPESETEEASDEE